MAGDIDPFRPATELAAEIERGELSPVDLVDRYLDRIEREDEPINAYVTVIEEAAREQAREAERAVEDEVERLVEETVDALESAGATVESATVDHDLSLDELCEAIETTFATSVVGVAETLKTAFGADLRDYPDQVSDSLLELLAIGDEKTVQEVARTGIVRTQLYDAVQECLAEYDLLVTPTLSTTGMELHTDRGLDWELALTWPFNWTGHPAASVPAG